MSVIDDFNLNCPPSGAKIYRLHDVIVSFDSDQSQQGFKRTKKNFNNKGLAKGYFPATKMFQITPAG